MGASAQTIEVNFRATGVDAVRAGIRAVRDEAKVAGDATRSFGEGSIYGIAELSRGLSRVAQTGTASSMAMRELAGGVMRLGSSLGPGAGLVGVLLLLGGTIAEVFMHAREEMKRTAEEFEAGVARMANASESTNLLKQLRDLQFGTPYDKNNRLQPASAYRKGAFKGSLYDLLGQRDMIDAELRNANPAQSYWIQRQRDQLSGQIAPLQSQADALTAAILNVMDQPASMNVAGLLPGMKSTAKSDEAIANEAKKRLKLIDESNKKYLEEQARYAKTYERTWMDSFEGVWKYEDEKRKEGDKNVAEQKQRFEKMAKDAAEALQKNIEAAAKAYEKGQAQINRYRNDGLSKEQIEELRAQAASETSRDRPELAPGSDAFNDEVDARLDELEKGVVGRAHQVGNTIAQSIAEGMRAGFASGSLADGFATATKGILAGLGAMFVEIGEHALEGLLYTAIIKSAFQSLNPAPGIGAALGLIALGSALEAAGSGGGHSSSMGHYAGSGAASSYAAVTANAPSVVDPRGIQRASSLAPQQPITVHATIIGKDDPQAQRQLLEMVARAQRRGSTSG